MLNKIKATILNCEDATGIKDISQIKKMKGFKSNYRIKIGAFRIGIEIENKTINFITVAHRKDIYKFFP